MEPQRHIAHIRKKYIEIYVKTYAPMFLCGKVICKAESKDSQLLFLEKHFNE